MCMIPLGAMHASAVLHCHDGSEPFPFTMPMPVLGKFGNVGCRIPALVDHMAGNLNIFESGAILWYLGETYDPEGKLWPKVNPVMPLQCLQPIIITEDPSLLYVVEVQLTASLQYYLSVMCCRKQRSGLRSCLGSCSRWEGWDPCRARSLLIALSHA